ncbi:hypothetical protein B0H13DRAFT_2512174 [Mycena leptocephala]|nr:hypothetical protein B0H13DRAFT_2512174 [Mycena leptocephala]
MQSREDSDSDGGAPPGLYRAHVPTTSRFLLPACGDTDTDTNTPHPTPTSARAPLSGSRAKGWTRAQLLQRRRYSDPRDTIAIAVRSTILPPPLYPHAAAPSVPRPDDGDTTPTPTSARARRSPSPARRDGLARGYFSAGDTDTDTRPPTSAAQHAHQIRLSRVRMGKARTAAAAAAQKERERTNPTPIARRGRARHDDPLFPSTARPARRPSRRTTLARPGKGKDALAAAERRSRLVLPAQLIARHPLHSTPYGSRATPPCLPPRRRSGSVRRAPRRDGPFPSDRTSPHASPYPPHARLPSDVAPLPPLATRPHDSPRSSRVALPLPTHEDTHAAHREHERPAHRPPPPDARGSSHAAHRTGPRPRRQGGDAIRFGARHSPAVLRARGQRDRGELVIAHPHPHPRPARVQHCPTRSASEAPVWTAYHVLGEGHPRQTPSRGLSGERDISRAAGSRAALSPSTAPTSAPRTPHLERSRLVLRGERDASTGNGQSRGTRGTFTQPVAYSVLERRIPACLHNPCSGTHARARLVLRGERDVSTARSRGREEKIEAKEGGERGGEAGEQGEEGNRERRKTRSRRMGGVGWEEGFKGGGRKMICGWGHGEGKQEAKTARGDKQVGCMVKDEEWGQRETHQAIESSRGDYGHEMQSARGWYTHGEEQMEREDLSAKNENRNEARKRRRR